MDDNSTEVKDISTSVPVFLLKLVSMLNDSNNHAYVDWTQAGTSFIVKDQVHFSKIVLPKYFKHNKFASFVRQLNMYGFRKITSLTQTGMVPERDEVEFYHYLFVRNEEHLLPQIKRKVNKPDALSRSSEDVSKVLESVKEMRSYQDMITHRLSGLKQENDELWREIMSLRQKHAHQQKVVNKLIQFLVNLVHQTGMGVKRRMPLMIDDGSSDSQPLHKLLKPTIYVEEASARAGLKESPGPIVSFPTTNRENSEVTDKSSGPYITEVLTSTSMGNVAPVTSVGDHLDTAQQTALSPQDTPEIQRSGMWLRDKMKSPDQESSSYNSGGLQPSTQLGSSSLSDCTQDSIPSHHDQITQYYQDDARLSLGDLTDHVDKMQNNINSIQDTLLSNDDIGLDNSLFHELFGAYSDVGPQENAQLLKDPLTGSEIVLQADRDQKNVDDLAVADLSDISDYL